MAHYAILNENNIVTQVIVGKNENEPMPEGYLSWEDYYGAKKTSYNTKGGVHSQGETPFRKNYAGIGYSYDSNRDAFIPPKPFPSWILNEETCLWEPPYPMPDDRILHWEWNESEQKWDNVVSN
jgi:hypothetical protein